MKYISVEYLLPSSYLFFAWTNFLAPSELKISARNHFRTSRTNSFECKIMFLHYFLMPSSKMFARRINFRASRQNFEHAVLLFARIKLENSNDFTKIEVLGEMHEN